MAQNSYLQIKSDDAIDKKIIDSLGYSKKHLNTKSVLDELNLFSEKLLKNGFLEYEKSEPLKINDSTFSIRFDLGKKLKFIYLYIGENSKLLNIEKDTLKILISETENFMNLTLLQLERNGYSLAQLKLINHRKEKNILFAELNIVAEKIRTLDDIVINGYDKFPEGHKKNIKRLYRNKVFNQENLKKIHDDFAKLRFVSQPKYPEILFTKDSTKVYVYLEKSKPNTFDGFIGFNNNEKKKLEINGYLDLQLQNILNGGEKFSILWRSDGKNQKTFNGAIEIPYLFKSPLGLKSQLNIFKQDSIFQNTQTSIDLGYYFNYNTKVFLGYQSTESSDIQNINSSNLSDFKNSFITSHLDYINLNQDDFLFPEKTIVYFKIGTGKRQLKTSSSNQFFSLVNLSQNIYLNKKNIFNVRSQNYFLNSDVYIINELYRFGGINSIRGFGENSLQANVFSSLLTEYRYVANPSLYFHTIVDVGYYQDKTSNIKNNLLGLGFGFGLITKNGLFNLIYANGSTKNQNIKLGNSIVHLSFKARF
ncbi:hypothetical protein [Flavobacterium sp.]|uniref:hypothetical protein n=1 Tax=Flavobacterium sp. TaxID=239 RepID=UPI002869FF9E|nr:hypothetical protein [Flavobacterium sp.]